MAILMKAWLSSWTSCLSGHLAVYSSVFLDGSVGLTGKVGV